MSSMISPITSGRDSAKNKKIKNKVMTKMSKFEMGRTNNNNLSNSINRGKNMIN
jgi:hypothetical protein